MKAGGSEARANVSFSQHFVTFPNGNQRYEIVGGRSGGFCRNGSRARSRNAFIPAMMNVGQTRGGLQRPALSGAGRHTLRPDSAGAGADALGVAQLRTPGPASSARSPAAANTPGIFRIVARPPRYGTPRGPEARCV